MMPGAQHASFSRELEINFWEIFNKCWRARGIKKLTVTIMI